jgi:polyhydroxyalkanoate synthesis regulator phasin
MVTAEERLQVLQMIESGSISSEEGKRLLQALKSHQEQEPDTRTTASQWVRFRVTNSTTGRRKFSANIPMQLVDVALKIARRFAPELDKEDIDDLQITLRTGIQGKVFELQDQESGELVEIFVE